MNDLLVLLTPNAKMQQSIHNVISDFIHHKKNVLLSFSVLLTLFYSSNGVMGLMKSFDRNIPGLNNAPLLNNV
ncbi:MAG: hypothetical protein IPI22_14120 [Bacteroidetes bacterium]|nr:hypothetical protein [Bacteroidota bacterium]